MSNYGAGMAAGYIIGSEAGRESEKSRRRRLSQMGEDQILLHVKADVGKVAQTVADTFLNWKVKDGQIYEKDEYPINIGWFFGGFITTLLAIWFFQSVIMDINPKWPSIILISIIGGIALGRTMINNIVDHIHIGTLKDYTTVRIQKFDSDGYRNINEDEILRIVEDLEDLYKKENEVKKSLKK